MGVFDIFKKKKEVIVKKEISAFQGRVLYSHTFTGEKNLGELGPIREYGLGYDSLRARSWQSFLESDICQTVINRYANWVIGSGLKLQAEPVKKVLETAGISIDQSFNEMIESRWSVFARSKRCDFANKKSLGKIAKSAFKNAKTGGDVLVILRYEKGRRSIQLVDGVHVKSPQGGNEYFPNELPNGNKIKNGIEFSPEGEPVAYYIQDWKLKYTRIPAKSESTGLTTAFLVYGTEYRLDNVRAMPLLSVILETVKKLERYKEAVVGSAEERQKIPYFIEHGATSTGENPLTQQLTQAYNYNEDLNDDLPLDRSGKELAKNVAATTNKQVYNMPPDSKMIQLESKNELNFSGFFDPNIDIVCATANIPPDVAKSKYNSNFSASRAALKDWEHTLNVERDDFTEQFYKPIYEWWLHIEILELSIQAPGYLLAFRKGDYMTLDAYRNIRCIGASVPHIDPEKEVRAARLKLGDTGASIPLSTVEAVTEALNGGEAYDNMEQYAKELEQSKSLGIKAEIPTQAPQ